MSVCLNSLGELCVLHKAGGMPLDAAEILRIVKHSAISVKKLDDAVEKALELDPRFATSRSYNGSAQVRLCPMDSAALYLFRLSCVYLAGAP